MREEALWDSTLAFSFIMQMKEVKLGQARDCKSKSCQRALSWPQWGHAQRSSNVSISEFLIKSRSFWRYASMTRSIDRFTFWLCWVQTGHYLVQSSGPMSYMTEVVSLVSQGPSWIGTRSSGQVAPCLELIFQGFHQRLAIITYNIRQTIPPPSLRPRSPSPGPFDFTSRIPGTQLGVGTHSASSQTPDVCQWGRMC